MVFLWPAWLLSLLPVAAVAAWALLRPARQVAEVASLELWVETLDALGRSARAPGRRAGPAWVLLLAGAAAAAVGLARPAVPLRSAGRRVAVEVHPSAELGPSAGPLRAAVGALLDRLSPADRVRLVLPAALGGAGPWTDAAAARRAVASLAVLPIPAGRLEVPDAGDVGGMLYRFVPAGRAGPDGPGVVHIELPTDLPAVGIWRLGAADVPGGTEVFVAVHNDGRAAWRGRVVVAAPAAGGAWRELGAAAVAVGAGGQRGLVLRVERAEALAIRVGEGPGAQGFLTRAEARRRRVALTGKDAPLLRRFVEADESLEPVGSPAEADVVIANRAGPPTDRPALVIDPPTAPPGRRRGAVLRNVLLGDAQLAGGHDVLRGVELAGAAVRAVRPWVSAGQAGGKVLVGVGGGALVLAEGGGSSGRPRRLYVAFELTGENTNLAFSEAFVVLLANAVRWLAPGAAAEARYERLRPDEAPEAVGWQRVAGSVPAGAEGGPLAWPGLFRDEAGRLRAVCLVALRGGVPRRPWRQAVAAAPLPAPEGREEAMELWPVLAAVAAGLWLAGWWARLR